MRRSTIWVLDTLCLASWLPAAMLYPADRVVLLPIEPGKQLRVPD